MRVVRSPTPTSSRRALGGRFDRVLLDPPCSGPRHAARAPRPALARDARGDRARCAAEQDAIARGGAPRAGARRRGSSTRSARSRRARSVVAGDDRARTLPAPRRDRRLLYCSRWRLTSGCDCPDCGEPWLRPTNLPGRYRCVYCLHRFELRSVCPDCGEHSTIVRMSIDRDHALQPLRRLDARRGLKRRVAPSILPPTSAACASRSPRSSTPARRSSTSTSWTATSSRRSSMGPQVRRGAARPRRRASSRRPPDDRARPSATSPTSPRPARDTITIHAEATPHVHYAVAADPRAGLPRGRRGLPVDAARASSSEVERRPRRCA